MQRGITRVLDFLYPPSCHICEEPLRSASSLCNKCESLLQPVKAPFCQKCGECFDGKIDTSFRCPNCYGVDLSFEFARAAYQANPTSFEFVHGLKYSKQIHLAREIARLTENAFSDDRFEPYLSDGILVPVPLHWRKLQQRSFNQAEEIARNLGKIRGMRYINALTRSRNTKTQTRHNRKQRLSNLEGAFSVKRLKTKSLANKHVILVDDVFTTGSTSHACSQALLDGGAHSVAVLTFLRG